ncbi:MAG: PilN domain-containing protein [Burkholderiaceae bacterium]
MSQQINLFQEGLLAPKQRFSAEVMAGTVLAGAVLIVAMSLWTLSTLGTLKKEAVAARAVQAQEQARLNAALAAYPSGERESAALQQQLVQAEATLQTRRALLDELERGRLDGENSRSALLQRVALTVPASAWLTDIQIEDDRLELSGRTLRPEDLRPWLARLATQPITAGQPLTDVRIERGAAPGSATAPAGAPESWGFTMVSSTGTGPCHCNGDVARRGSGAMKPLWKQHWRRIEALSLRERLMIVVSVVFVMGAIADTLVLAPAKAQQNALRAEAATQARELDALRQKLNSAARDAGSDGPRDSLQQRLARSIDETKNVDRQIGERLGDAGRPARLPELVDQVLRRNDRLTLTRLITVAERPGEKSAAKGKETPGGGFAAVASRRSGCQRKLPRHSAVPRRSRARPA